LNSYLSTLRSPTAVQSSGHASPLPISSEPVLVPNYKLLDLKTPDRLEKNLEQIIEKLDEYKNEESNVAFLTRQIAREKMKAESYAAKRREENATRVAQGLAPLPEEDVSRLFKIPNEPSRLESMLLLGQIEGLSKNLEREAGETLVQSYVARAGTVA
jgi:translation initiation factor 3 subunit H